MSSEFSILIISTAGFKINTFQPERISQFQTTSFLSSIHDCFENYVYFITDFLLKGYIQFLKMQKLSQRTLINLKNFKMNTFHKISISFKLKIKKLMSINIL